VSSDGGGGFNPAVVKGSNYGFVVTGQAAGHHLDLIRSSSDVTGIETFQTQAAQEFIILPLTAR
jgi:hypothetical protein